MGWDMRKLVLAFAGLLLSGVSAQATEVYDQNLMHGVYYGSGNGLSPEDFAVVNNNSIELGLRAKLTPCRHGASGTAADRRLERSIRGSAGRCF